MYQPITGTGSGIAPVVNLSWPFLDKAHVNATVAGVPAVLTWTGASQVTFAAVVPNGTAWVVFRETASDIPLVDFTNGSVLTEGDLDLSQAQALYRLQELQQPTVGGTALAASSGAGLLGWIASGIGAVVRTIRDKLRESVSIADYNAVGDGIADDTAAVQAAIDSLGAAGGNVNITKGQKVFIGSNLTVKPNVHLRGPHWFVGSPKDNSSAPYGSLGGALKVASTATITLKGGASVAGLLVYRNGMTFPTADTSAFAGTAFTAGGDDVSVTHSMILGFNKAIYSSGYQRGRFLDLLLDNLNGIEVTASYDILKIARVHAWPFATIESATAAPAVSKFYRSGKAFYLHDGVDFANVADCFSYGYQRGFQLDSVAQATLTACSVDGPYGVAGADVYAGSRGFSIGGTSANIRLIAPTSTSQEIAYNLDTAAGAINFLVAPIARNITAHGFFFGAGDWIVTGGNVDYVTSNGVTYSNAASTVSLEHFRFGQNVALPLNVTVAATSDKLRLSNNPFPAVAAGTSPVGGIGSLAVPSVASASPLALPATGTEFNITGTTGFSAIQRGWAGREITLFFGGVLTVTHGTGSVDAVRLSGAANFATTAGGTLKLRHNGTQWYEVGRAA